MSEEEHKVKQQCLGSITISSLVASAVNGIVGFVAVYFFKPIWDKLVSYWKKK
jgi:uncharacterized membrane protein